MFFFNFLKLLGSECNCFKGKKREQDFIICIVFDANFTHFRMISALFDFTRQLKDGLSGTVSVAFVACASSVRCVIIEY